MSVEGDFGQNFRRDVRPKIYCTCVSVCAVSLEYTLREVCRFIFSQTFTFFSSSFFSLFCGVCVKHCAAAVAPLRDVIDVIRIHFWHTSARKCVVPKVRANGDVGHRKRALAKKWQRKATLSRRKKATEGRVERRKRRRAHTTTKKHITYAYACESRAIMCTVLSIIIIPTSLLRYYGAHFVCVCVCISASTESPTPHHRPQNHQQGPTAVRVSPRGVW